jgi:hypothetical protein
MGLLRRHVWVIDLIGIGIGAALAGHAAAVLISGALMPVGSATPVRGAQPPATLLVAHDKLARQSIEDDADVVGRSTECCTPAHHFADCVRKIGPFAYEVRRAFGNEMWSMKPPGPILIPEPRGIRVFARSDGAFAALGLRSGDLAMRVNDAWPLSEPDHTLAAYTALRSADHIWLLIERGGRPIRIDYWIR